MRRTIIALAVLLIPVVSQAQVRGRAGAGAVAHPMISAPRAVPHSGPSYSRAPGSSTTARVPQGRAGAVFYAGHQNLGNRPVGRTPIATSKQSAFVPDFTGVPGLGFDWVHYAAVHPGRGRRPGNRGGYQGYFPFFDAGFLLPYAQTYADAPADNSQAYDYQPQGPVDIGGGYAADASDHTYSRPATSYDVVVTPQNPNEAYIFVKRDGTVFFAVAYSWESGNLCYVTQEGLRRSVSRVDLDLNATQQFNEQRGFSFRLPA
jgi:hypothetical protein